MTYVSADKSHPARKTRAVGIRHASLRAGHRGAVKGSYQSSGRQLTQWRRIQNQYAVSTSRTEHAKLAVECLLTKASDIGRTWAHDARIE